MLSVVAFQDRGPSLELPAFWPLLVRPLFRTIRRRPERATLPKVRRSDGGA